jgi:hypothetical protein
MLIIDYFCCKHIQMSKLFDTRDMTLAELYLYHTGEVLPSYRDQEPEVEPLSESSRRFPFVLSNHKTLVKCFDDEDCDYNDCEVDDIGVHSEDNYELDDDELLLQQFIRNGGFTRAYVDTVMGD